MNWDIYKAKAWMLKTGMNHIRDGLFYEGGKLVYESKWGEGCDTEEAFRYYLADICCWDDDSITDAVKDVMK